MKLSATQYNILFLTFISFILFVAIFKWIDFLVENDYIQSTIGEGFGAIRSLSVGERLNSGTSVKEFDTTTHTVDLPLTTTYSCRNFCGPPARCSITGQQCTSDIDCPGCQPNMKLHETLFSRNKEGFTNENAAGKLTSGTTPTYSQLTTDIGTQAILITSNKFEKPAMPYFGVNVWRSSFDEDRKVFDDRYKPPHLENMPTYPPRYSLTGEFMDEGPLASNSYLK